MTIGLLKEEGNENRVSLTPETAAQLIKKGHSLHVERGAGAAAFAADEEYAAAGCTLATRAEVIGAAQVLLSIHPPSDAITRGQVLVGTFSPLYSKDAVQQWAASGATVFSLDLLPRTTRAQSMDVLSSQANIAGYKAVLLAASRLPRYFPMLTTAAGSVPPARVLILGAGVAGLQAVATARRLGAVVEVFDTRPAVKEEVASLGARFVEVEGAADASASGGYAVEQSDEFKQRQAARIAEAALKSDIVIATAQIPGKAAPLLLDEATLKGMRPGSIVVDIAAGTGGNTPVTREGETVSTSGAIVVGAGRLPSEMPADASKLYGKNVASFLQLLAGEEGALLLNWEDDLISNSCVVHEGAPVNSRIQELMQQP